MHTLSIIPPNQRSRYRGLQGLRSLGDATYRPPAWSLRTPVAPADGKAILAAEQVGSWWDFADEPVRRLGNRYFVICRAGQLPVPGIANTVPVPPQLTVQVASSGGNPIAGVVSTYHIWEIVPQAAPQVPPASGKDPCPPQENCREELVNKTLYVSARPIADAIEIPVAFEKVICQGDAPTPPEIDCDELLRALQQNVAQGGVPGMEMQGLGRLGRRGHRRRYSRGRRDYRGLGAVTDPDQSWQGTSSTPPPAQAPTTPPYDPNWCDDCTTTLVQAVAYVTDKPAQGAVPFQVQMKVLVCETGAKPKIDCEQVVEALRNGMVSKGIRALDGLAGCSSCGLGVLPGEWSFDKAAEQMGLPSASTTTQQPTTNSSPMPVLLLAAAAAAALVMFYK